MRYLTLPHIPVPVSRIALGTAGFSPDAYDNAAAIMDSFIANGGNLIDTAHIYGMGKSERTIGQWLAERNNRDQVILLGKGCHPIGDSGPRVGAQFIKSDLNDSLERLGTNNIDLYLLHRDNPEVPVGEIVEALNAEQQAGRIKAFGGSNWTIQRIVEANAYAAEHGLNGFVISSPNLSLARPKEPMWAGCISASEEDRAWHKQQQFPLASWSSQAGGFLSGRYTREDTSNADMLRVWYNDANFARLERAIELGKQKGVSSMAIAQAYVLNQPFPTIGLVGPANVNELLDSFRAAEIELSADELAYLDAFDAA